ncbi:hypothetical protein RI129_002987 [Pyrocoelia pectoralis]|uniref:Myb/SANT-like DNA-binding domain-containing protein n=1 Tax=Pyrocoelia pectoralis TaxID=417401 RepID=A0AAN7ZIB2_9COLE
MNKNGYSVTEELLDRKMRNMKKSYKTIKDNNKKSNTGRGRISWEYFDTFEEIFADDVTINCSSTISSMQKDTASGNTNDAEVNTFSNDPCISTLPCAPVSSVSPFQPIHPGVPGPSSSASSPLRSVTSLHKGSEKSTRMSTLHYLRKKQLDVEEKRIKAIMEVKRSIDVSNNIQQERNNLLQQFLLLKTARVEAQDI